jgi:hypothetical protein
MRGCRFLLSALAFLSCISGVCAGDQWRAYPGSDYAGLFRDGVQIGTWTRNGYCRLEKDGTWANPVAEPPVMLPDLFRPLNFGIGPGPSLASPERFRLNGIDVSKEDALRALVPPVPAPEPAPLPPTLPPPNPLTFLPWSIPVVGLLGIATLYLFRPKRIRLKGATP